jgi:hypothetical protein
MSDFVKGLLTVLIAPTLSFPMLALLNRWLGHHLGDTTVIVVAAVFGLAYGLMAGILLIYNLSSLKGWLELVIDTTWSLPTTFLGFIVGSLIFPFVANPSRADSENKGWISYKARGSGAYGNTFLQTLGTVNLGGPGQHERMHLLQERIFGPAFLPIQVVNYAATFLIQVVWTFTVGGLLYLTKIRQKPYFEPPSGSAMKGFLGWIYYATFFELWAYATGNP